MSSFGEGDDVGCRVSMSFLEVGGCVQILQSITLAAASNIIIEYWAGNKTSCFKLNKFITEES